MKLICAMPSSPPDRQDGETLLAQNHDYERWRDHGLGPHCGRIELENFLVLETQTIDRGEQSGTLTSG
jgi:hypothetical protein